MQTESLKKSLEDLRNETVLVFTVTNIIWIVLITLLAQHADLTVLHTNALGLGFLVVYGLIVVIQFLALIWHRLTTVLHSLAHPVPDTTHIISLGFEEFDVDRLDDVSEAINYFSSEFPADSDDETLSPVQQENRRLRQVFQKMHSGSNTLPSEETKPLLSTSNREKYSS